MLNNYLSPACINEINECLCTSEIRFNETKREETRKYLDNGINNY